MPRKRTAIGASAEKKIAALLARGGTAESIAKKLRAAGVKGVSVRTIGRRLAELRGPQRTQRGSSKAAGEVLREHYAAAAAKATAGAIDDKPLPNPEEIPEDVTIEQIDSWLLRADTLGKAAFEKGDAETVGKMGRLSKGLLEARRKAIPITPDDPTDTPDMRALGEQVEIRLLKQIDDIVKGR